MNTKADRVAAATTDAAVLRAEYARRFPVWSQQLITHVTGKAAANQPAPRTLLPPIPNVIATTVQWPVSIAAGAFMFHLSTVAGFVFTPIAVLLGVNSLRRLQVVSAHHAVHREILSSQRISYLIQAVVSALSLVHNWEDYFEDHIRGHHSRKIFTTAADPDAVLLLRLGFLPGTPLPDLQRRTYFCLVSPRFHWLFLKARFVTNFVSAPVHRRLMALVSVSAVVGTFFVMPPMVALVLVILPLFPLYHMSALLQFLSEHNWLITEHAPTSAEDYARRTRGRFFMAPLPDRDAHPVQRVLGWLVWTLRTIVFVIPCRYGVMSGNLPAHDLHHLFSQDHEWTKALWHRQRIIDSGDDKGMGGREYTTLRSAVDSVLIGISVGS
jgi:hypothetical protein